jgi:hypothetical protein
MRYWLEGNKVRCFVTAALLMFFGLEAGSFSPAHGQRTAPIARFAYLPGRQGCPRVYQFRVDADGHKTPLSPSFVSLIGSAYAVVVSPDRRSVYVPEGDYFSVAQFQVRRNGTLWPMRHPEVAADAHPMSLVIDPGGRNAYVSCSHGDICQYRVCRDGSLVPLSPPAVSIAADASRQPLLIKATGRGQRQCSFVFVCEAMGA